MGLIESRLQASGKDSLDRIELNNVASEMCDQTVIEKFEYHWGETVWAWVFMSF